VLVFFIYYAEGDSVSLPSPTCLILSASLPYEILMHMMKVPPPPPKPPPSTQAGQPNQSLPGTKRKKKDGRGKPRLFHAKPGTLA